MNRGLDRAGSHSVVLGAATAMLMALATTGTSVSAAETSNDSSAGRAASGLGSQLVPVRFTSEEYRLRGEVYWHRGDQQPAVAVTPGDRAFARVQVDVPAQHPRARAAPPSLVPHQPHRPAERGEVHQLHRPLAIRPQRTATALTRRSQRPPADVHPQRAALAVSDAEDLHIAQSHQQLAHARRVALHRDPPDSRLPISTDSGGSLAFSRGPLPPPLRPQTMLLCLSSRDFSEVLLVALGEPAVVVEAPLEG